MSRIGAHIRQLWSETRWILLGSIWLAALVLGYLGFARFSSENDRLWQTGDLLYRTLQRIILESGSVDGRVNWMLETARFLLPALTVYTLLQAGMDLFHEQMQWLRLWRIRDHVVVCGFGRKGSYLASELLSSGLRVVVVEKEPDDGAAADLRKRGGILLTGDATDRDLLASARVQRARHLACLLGEDSHNLQVAFQAYQLTHGRRRGTLTCIVHLTSPDWLSLMQNSELSQGIDAPFQLETFYPYARAARLLMQADPGWQETANPAALPGRLLVVGLGRLGESLIFQAAHHWHRFQQRDQLDIIVLDREAAEKTALLLQKHPQLNQVCKLHPMQVDLSSTALLDNTLKTVHSQMEIQRAYICLSDPILSYQVCLRLCRNPVFLSVPVYVRMDNQSGLSGLLKKPVPGLSAAGQVITFDLYERTCSAALVVAGVHELLARDLHDLYRTGEGTPPTSGSSSLSWDQLPEELKESNRLQANRIHRLLDLAGYRIGPLQNWDENGCIFQPEEVEQMACMEHELWRGARQAGGWRAGKQKDEKSRLHPDLVPWEDLPELEREKNRKMVRQLPALLARIGYQIDKAST